MFIKDNKLILISLLILIYLILSQPILAKSAPEEIVSDFTSAPVKLIKSTFFIFTATYDSAKTGLNTAGKTAKDILTFESIIDKIIPDYPAVAEVQPPQEVEPQKPQKPQKVNQSAQVIQQIQQITQIQPKTVIKEIINQSDLNQTKKDILAIVSNDLSALKKELASTMKTENVYYFNEAAKAARTDGFNSEIDFNENVDFKGNAIFAKDITVSGEISGTIRGSNDLIVSGLQFGGGTTSVSYSRGGSNITDHSLTDADDLLISGLFEVDEGAYFDSGVSQSLDIAGTVSASDDIWIGDDLTVSDYLLAAYASVSQDFSAGGSIFYVNVGSQSYQFSGTGSASFIGPVDLSSDLNAASASFTNLFGTTIADGALTITGGDITSGDLFSFAYGSASQEFQAPSASFTNFSTTHASISDDLTIGATTVFRDGYIDSSGALSINTTNNQAITFGTGKLSFTLASVSDSLTVTDILRGGTLTDGTATLIGGNWTGIGSLSGTRASLSDDLDLADLNVTSASFGTIYAGTWNGSAIDISDYTNLAATSPLSLVGDTLDIDYASGSSDGYLLGSDYEYIVGHTASANEHINWTTASSSFFTTGTFDLDNTASISGDITGYGALTISGTTDLANVAAFTLTGAITGNSQDITGIDDLGAVGLAVTHASVSDDLTVSDVFTVRDGIVSVSDDFYVGNNMLFADVSADTIYSSASWLFESADIDGTASLSLLTVGSTASSTFAGDLDIEGDVNIGGGDLYVDASSGNVGIGTTTPGVKLYVSGNTILAGSTDPRVEMTVGGGAPTTSALAGNLIVSAPSSQVLEVGAAFSPTYVWMQARHKTSLSDMYPLVLQQLGGGVGIGDTAPGYTLSVDGTASVSGAVYFPNTPSVADLQTDASGQLINGASDIRLKKNIDNINNALDRILTLRGVQFNWKSPEEGNDYSIMDDSIPHFGFIAQEVASSAIPELSHPISGTDYMGVRDSELIPLLVEGMKELASKQAELELKLDESGSLGVGGTTSNLLAQIINTLKNFGITIKNGITHIAKLAVEQFRVVTKENQDNVVGRAVFPAQNVEYRVENKLVEANSYIFITFMSDTGGRTWHISEIAPGHGFTLRLSDVTPEPLDFKYWIVLVEDQGAGEGASGQPNDQSPDLNQQPAPTPTNPICGDGELYAGEECDDGNLINGDGCNSTCMLENNQTENDVIMDVITDVVTDVVTDVMGEVGVPEGTPTSASEVEEEPIIEETPIVEPAESQPEVDNQAGGEPVEETVIETMNNEQ